MSRLSVIMFSSDTMSPMSKTNAALRTDGQTTSRVTHTHTHIGIVMSWETVNLVRTTGQTSCLLFCVANYLLISTSMCLSMSMCDYVSCLWFVIETWLPTDCHSKGIQLRAWMKGWRQLGSVSDKKLETCTFIQKHVCDSFSTFVRCHGRGAGFLLHPLLPLLHIAYSGNVRIHFHSTTMNQNNVHLVLGSTPTLALSQICIAHFSFQLS